MAKLWVLDTETKGTGARMVPLEEARPRSGPESAPVLVRDKPAPRPPEAPLPIRPRRFKLVDVMTRRTLAEDVDTRTIVDLLGEARSAVDVSIYVWEPHDDKWRPLTYPEKKLLWGFRQR